MHGFNDPRSIPIVHLLKLALHSATIAIGLECVPNVTEFPALIKFIEIASERLHMHLAQVKLDTCHIVLMNRSRWLATLIKKSWPMPFLDGWPALPQHAQPTLKDFADLWCEIPDCKLQQLLITDIEKTFMLSEKHNVQGIHSVWPTVTHSAHVTCQPCPCERRGKAIQTRTLQRKGIWAGFI